MGQCKDLTDLQRSGRPRATATEDDQQINQITEQETFATSHDMKEDLAMRGVEVTQRTIRRRLNEAGEKFSLPMKKPLLSEQHRLNRLNWAHNHRSTNWNKIIFSDETTVILNRVKGRAWNFPGIKN